MASPDSIRNAYWVRCALLLSVRAADTNTRPLTAQPAKVTRVRYRKFADRPDRPKLTKLSSNPAAATLLVAASSPRPCPWSAPHLSKGVTVHSDGNSAQTIVKTPNNASPKQASAQDLECEEFILKYMTQLTSNSTRPVATSPRINNQ